MTATIPLVQHPTDADREYGLAVINACIPRYVTGMHAADLAVLRHEAERLEGLEASPVIKTMRAIVGAELACREVASC